MNYKTLPITNIPFYIYRIACIPTNQFYWGARWYHVKENRLPENDLWKIYYTSSIPIKELIKQYGKDQFNAEIYLTGFNRI